MFIKEETNLGPVEQFSWVLRSGQFRVRQYNEMQCDIGEANPGQRNEDEVNAM